MKRRKVSVWAIPAVCLAVFLLFFGNRALGQQTPGAVPGGEQKPTPLTVQPPPPQEPRKTVPDGRQEAVSPPDQPSSVQQVPPQPKGLPVAIPQHSLTINRAGTGQGKVTNAPAGTSFRKGTSVTLQAVPEAGSAFDGWSGSCSGSSRTCSISMVGDRAVTASFSLRTHTIHARLPVNGVIHPSGTVKAVHGGKRRFQIIPLPGYRVSDVLVDKVSVGAVNSYTFDNVTGDHVLEVIFLKQQN